MAMLPVPARFPTGWYCLAFASDLAPGERVTRRFAGRDVVLFRGASGRVSVVEAHCPHLGAHLGYSGQVEGEDIRCNFHGFCFGADGACTRTGYGTKPPPKAKLGVLHAREQDGLVIAWFSNDGAAPAWEPPPAELAGFTALSGATLALRGHPQETSENGADIGHLVHTHGYEDVQLHEVAAEGPLFRAKYSFTRSIGLISRGSRKQRIEIDVRIHGLGYSVVLTRIADAGFEALQWVLSTPTDDERIELRLGLRVKPIARPAKIHPGLALVPRPLATRLVQRLTFRGFLQDVRQDLPIWEHKVHVHPPALAEGDGPIGKYRQWAKQFYEPPVQATPLRTVG